MCSALLIALLPGFADPAETVTWTTEAGPNMVVGRVVLEGDDGGVLLEGRDGTLHAVAGSRLGERTATGEPFAPMGGEELAATLAAELGAGAETHVTLHFAIASTASPEFTDWAGDLLEAVHAGFVEEFAPPRFPTPAGGPAGPLPALILKDRTAFEAYARRPDQAARGVNPALSQGYYDPVSNRIVLYDFAGTPAGGRRESVRERAANRQANVATVAHEAIHQLAYNAGLHARLASNPIWLTEGLAMQGEATSRTSPLGWRGFADGVNPVRSKAFRAMLTARRRDRQLRETNPLPRLVGSEDVFTDPTIAGAAYAASWALVRHLRAERPEAFAAYLKELAALPPLAPVTAEERLATFKTHFGEDLDGLWDAVQRVR
ncbi:DUF1570 domain-containing protein [Alienimonas chondri]|uniref:DUF1570 domain-containing protein n=1 Tax=Alienimonas chondri TaxID=2681879 RepID=A0ABX1V8N9_9PLAN|nr:DUF1570 domain-containing protein [Alienimonas chondri]NNJ24198.1 hypothetical protein [Alienimonas chondri]